MAVESPAVYMSTAVSPTTRPAARTQPVTMPSMDAGSTTVRMVRQGPAPSAKAPSR